MNKKDWEKEFDEKFTTIGIRKTDKVLAMGVRLQSLKQFLVDKLAEQKEELVDELEKKKERLEASHIQTKSMNLSVSMEVYPVGLVNKLIDQAIRIIEKI